MRETLTACLITKNESRFLARCLASVRPYVDAIIVCDTGSTDDTKAIAESFGAEVRNFPWCDDFAAARNESIRDVKTKWWLQIDADEELLAGDGEKIQAVLRSLSAREYTGGQLRLHNALSLEDSPADIVSGAKRNGELNLVPRLNLTHPENVYRGCVHECTTDFHLARGMRVDVVGLNLVHWGSVEEIVKSRDKRTRNIELLRRRCEEDADMPTYWGYLAMELMQTPPQGEKEDTGEKVRRLEKVWEAVSAGWDAVRRRAARGTASRLAVVKANLEHQEGRYWDALDTVRTAVVVDGNNSDFDYLTGFSYEGLAHGLPDNSPLRAEYLLQAASSYTFAINPVGADTVNYFVSGSKTYLSMGRLGHVLFLLGEEEKAERCFKEALKLCPAEANSLAGMQMLRATRQKKAEV